MNILLKPGVKFSKYQTLQIPIWGRTENKTKILSILIAYTCYPSLIVPAFFKRNERIIRYKNVRHFDVMIKEKAL